MPVAVQNVQHAQHEGTLSAMLAQSEIRAPFFPVPQAQSSPSPSILREKQKVALKMGKMFLYGLSYGDEDTAFPGNAHNVPYPPSLHVPQEVFHSRPTRSDHSAQQSNGLRLHMPFLDILGRLRDGEHAPHDITANTRSDRLPDNYSRSPDKE